MVFPIKFSIIILSYNRCDLLQKALASIMHQTYPADEIVVIDGGSTDGTKEMVGVFDGVHFEVVLERNSEGELTGSLAHSANTGFKMARNNWVYFMSDDAVLDEKCLEVLAREIVQHPNYAAYSSKFNLYQSRNTHGHRYLQDLLLLNFGAIDKRVLNRMGGFDQSYRFYGWDIDFSYRLWTTGHKIFKSDSLVYHNWSEQEANDPYDDEKRFYQKVEEYKNTNKEISRWATLLKTFTLYRTAHILGPVVDELMKQTPPGGHIAEIGFGSGMTSILLANLGYMVTALDIDPDVVDLLKDKIGYINGLYVQKQDMFDLRNFDDNYFDVMYHQGVLEHFTDEEIVKTLKQQGRVAVKVIFDVPNDKRLDKFQLYGNERFLSVKHWLRLIDEAGLEVEKVCGRRLPSWADMLPKKWHHRDSWLAKWKGESNTYVCKRSCKDLS